MSLLITRIRHFDPDVAGQLKAAGLGDYARLVDRDSAEAVYSTTGTATHRLDLPPGAPTGRRRAAYLKVYRPGRHGWTYLLRASKPWIEAFNLRLLAKWDIPAVRVLATGSRRTWWGLRDAFLLTEEWTGGQMLSAYAQQNWPIRGSGPKPFRKFEPANPGPISPQHRRDQIEIGQRLATAVRRMHQHHFYHIDLQWRNVMVRRRDGHGWEVCLLDCPRGGWRGSIPGRIHGQVRDLASLDRLANLYLPRGERLRWLCCYLDRPRLDEAGRKLARRVIAYRAKYEKYRGPRVGPSPGRDIGRASRP